MCQPGRKLAIIPQLFVDLLISIEMMVMVMAMAIDVSVFLQGAQGDLHGTSLPSVFSQPTCEFGEAKREWLAHGHAVSFINE